MNKLVMLTASIVLGLCFAHSQRCDEIAATAEMSRAKSMHDVTSASKRAGHDYRAGFVLAFRSFQLQPRSKDAAERLLRMIPTDDTQQKVLMMRGDSLCDAESVADMRAMAQVNENFPRELARAVLLAPNFLASYVRFSIVAVQDPHSEYAVEMKKVCQKAHPSFVRAVNQLSEKERRVLTTQVMDANSCRVISVPEGEK